MRPGLIVVANPSLRQHLCFLHGVKKFSVQEFITHTCVETFDITILRWAARFDTCYYGACIARHMRMCLAVNSLPLSLLIYSGTSWVSLRSEISSIASLSRQLQRGALARYSFVYSSRMFKKRFFAIAGLIFYAIFFQLFCSSFFFFPNIAAGPFLRG